MVAETALPDPDRLLPGDGGGVRSWELAWQITPRSATWRQELPDGRCRFLKIRAFGAPVTLADEAERLRWAGRYAPVPEVVAAGASTDAEWLLLAGLPGVDATVSPLAAADPERLVTELGAGLRRFHELLPVADCPFDFSTRTALSLVEARLAAGAIDPREFHEEHAGLTPEQAWARLLELEPEGGSAVQVVCHGDYCAPNALLDGDRVTAYLDLGELGAADRWWDLAIGGWSTCWNFGPEWESAFYAGYGLAPSAVDHRRVAFFRLLYDLVS